MRISQVSLVCMLLVCGAAPVSAQEISFFSLSTAPTGRATATDHTALAGTLILTENVPVSVDGIPGASITANYGLPITNTISGPGQATILLKGTGCYQTLGSQNLAVNNSAGSITITVPRFPAGCN